MYFTQRDRDSHSDRQKVRTDRQTYIQIKDSNRHRDKPTDRQTGIHTDRRFQHTENQTDGRMRVMFRGI